MSGRTLCYVAFAVAITVIPGCSFIIANSGTTLSDLTTRDVVTAQFGSPDKVAELDLVEPGTGEVRRFEVEQYRVHGNYNDGPMPPGAGGLLLLALDPWLTCVELYETAREYVLGHELAFVYDEDGNAIGHQYPQPFLQSIQAPSNRGVNVLRWDRHEPEGDAAPD